MGYYWPEGMLLETEENRYYLQNEETLQSAMRIGQSWRDGRCCVIMTTTWWWIWAAAAGSSPGRRAPWE